jgi:hypothetical protein
MRIGSVAFLFLAAAPAGAREMNLAIDGSVTMEFPSDAVITAVAKGGDNPLEITAGFISYWCEQASDFTGQQLDAGTTYTFLADGGPVALLISVEGSDDASVAGQEVQVMADGSPVVFERAMILDRIMLDYKPFSGEARLTVCVDGEDGYEVDFMPASDAAGFEADPLHEYAFTTSSLDPMIVVFRPEDGSGLDGGD